MLKSFISIFFILVYSVSFSQEKTKDTEKVKDTVKYKDRYGLRIGMDVFQPIYSLIDKDKKGLEFVGDYRITKRFYLAAELGYSEATNKEDYFEFYTNGQYIKAGVDFNAYKNWIGMENMIVVGLRYAFSNFNQTLNKYTINADPFLPSKTITTPVIYDKLNAQWIELVLGLKAEILHNVFMGFSFRWNQKIAFKEPDNFKNLYIPGFNKVYVNNNGFGFNYTISYLIPFYRK